MRPETMHRPAQAHDINNFEGLQTDINSGKRIANRGGCGH